MTTPVSSPAADHRSAFERNGYTVVPRFASAATCNALKDRMKILVEEFDPNIVQSVFSTRDQSRTTDQYFLESGDKIRFFFEEDAFDAAGVLQCEKQHAINKVGHALHDLDAEFAAFSRSEPVRQIVAALEVDDPLLVQSMYIFKQPRVGGEVDTHQDSTFLYTSPPSVIGLWLAIEDATLENGCLWALPGGHRGGLKARFVRGPDQSVTMQPLDDSAWQDEEFVPLEVPQGALIALHGTLPHRSGPNRSQQSRHAYTLHVVSGKCAWSEDNWLQRGEHMPPTRL